MTFFLRAKRAAAFVFFLSLIWTVDLNATPAAKQARVTQLTGEVQLLAGEAEARPAALNENLDEGTTVRTGTGSRAEITFPDRTIVRLSVNSTIQLKGGTRNLELGEGAILVEAPRSAKGARVCGAEIAAAVSGTTAVVERYDQVYKFLVLEGTGRLYRPRHFGDSVLVQAGQMVIGREKAAVSDPVDFDLGLFSKSCRLITDFPALRSERLMAYEIQKQQRQKSKKNLIDTNLVIFGGGTLVSLVDPAQASANRAAETPAAKPEEVPNPEQPKEETPR